MINAKLTRMTAALVALSFLFSVILTGCGEEKSTVEPAGNGGAPAASGDSGAKIDACALVTQADATALFGKPAVPEEGTPVFDPNMMGECLWTWDTETGGQLLQFRVFNGPQYYSELPDAQPFDIGEQGNVRTNTFTGVDVEWIQDAKTYTLSYSTVGTDVPDATTKAEEVKQLAKKVASE